jgi:hypothetical protein
MAHGKAFFTYTRQNNVEKPGHIALAEARFKPEIPVFERFETIRSRVGKMIDISKPK